MESPDPYSTDEPRRDASESSRDNSQPPNTTSNHIETLIGNTVGNTVDLHNTAALFGVELTPLPSRLGEDVLGVSQLDGGPWNEIGSEEPRSTTGYLHTFRRGIDDQFSQLSETARFWLEQDPEDIATLPPVAPPGSPESISEELDGPSLPQENYPRVEMPPLLLGGFYQTPAPVSSASTLLNFTNPSRGQDLDGYDGMPVPMRSYDFGDDDDDDDDELDFGGYRPRLPPAGESPRPFRVNSSIGDYEMPWFVPIFESSDDGAPGDAADLGGYQPSSLLTGRHAERRQRESSPLLEMGIPSAFGGPSERRAADNTWRIRRMEKLLNSLEFLDESLLDRFCRVGGGGGEHNDECTICWEALKVEPTGGRSWTAAGSVLSGGSAQASTAAGNFSSTSSGTQSSSDAHSVSTNISGAAALPCLHVFHSKCLVPWFEKLATTCPTCRFDLDPDRLLPFSTSPLASLRGLVDSPLISVDVVQVQDNPLPRPETNPQRGLSTRFGNSLSGHPVGPSSMSRTPGTEEHVGSWPFETSLDSVLFSPASILDTESEQPISSNGVSAFSDLLTTGPQDAERPNLPISQRTGNLTAPNSLGTSSTRTTGSMDVNVAVHGAHDGTLLGTTPTRVVDVESRERQSLVDSETVGSSSLLPMDDTPYLGVGQSIDRVLSSGSNPPTAPGGAGQTVDHLTTGRPQQAIVRSLSTETRPLPFVRDLVLDAYVRFPERPNTRDALSPSQRLHSRDAAIQRGWVPPKGPVDGGVAAWIGKREVELRASLEEGRI